MTPSSSEDFSTPVAAELARRVEAAERQVRLLETVLAATDDYGFILDLEGRVLFANRNFLKLLGRTLDEVVGRDGHQLGFPAWHADMHRREVQQVAATGQPVRGEVPYTPPDGRFRWFEYRFAPVLNAQNEVEVIAGSSRDITERRQSEAMDRFLVALDDAIRPLGHERDISLTCARLLGDKLGVERCAYAYFEDEDIMILGDHVRGVPSIVGRYRLRDFGVEAAEHMRRNQPFVVNDIETHQPPIGDLAPYRALGIHATIAMPLHKEGKLVAGIAVQQKQPRQWTAADILLVKAVAGRCWESIERARVAEALRAREQLYRSLSEISEVARSESDPALIMRSALRKVAALLGATRCAYADVAADEEHFTIRDDYTAEGYTSSTGDYRLSGFGQKVPAEQRAGQCSVVRDVEHELGVDGAGLLSLQIRAIICCPLIRRGKLVAMMAVHQAAPRNWSASEIALFHTAVERCWAEVERAQVARALAESERQFRQLADAMPQIVFTALPDGTVDYFNRRWYEYTGFPEDGRMGDESWVGVHEPEALSRVAQTWAESLRTGRPYEIQYRLRRHDGMWRWHLGRALPVRDAAGNVIRWFGTNTDIHEQRTLLEENQHLIESEREARSEAERVGRMKDEFL
ncbi:MAG TPA: PAS domain S-box protein, partial [Opitutus sp.]|nr:PAS domain S-box protein [Opitutus sp.]